MTSKNKNSQGFTIIEILVALLVFTLTITLAVTIFIQVLQAQQRVLLLQDIQDNARYAMELMAKEIRMSRIATGAGSSAILDIVAHKKEGDIDVRYSKSGDNKLLRNGKQITSDHVKVENLKFHIGKGAEIHPRVTVVMEIVPRQPTKLAKRVRINLQTTISSRYYYEVSP